MLECEITAGNRLDELCQGDFVVVQYTVSNAEWYPWHFVIAEIHKDVSNIDTTSTDASIPILVYRPDGALDNVHLRKKNCSVDWGYK